MSPAILPLLIIGGAIALLSRGNAAPTATVTPGVSNPTMTAEGIPLAAALQAALQRAPTVAELAALTQVAANAGHPLSAAEIAQAVAMLRGQIPTTATGNLPPPRAQPQPQPQPRAQPQQQGQVPTWRETPELFRRTQARLGAALMHVPTTVQMNDAYAVMRAQLRELSDDQMVAARLAELRTQFPQHPATLSAEERARVLARVVAAGRAS